MVNKKKLKLNVRFSKGLVVCAKSPEVCNECKDIKGCETISTYYNPYEGIKECFSNNEKRR